MNGAVSIPVISYAPASAFNPSRLVRMAVRVGIVSVILAGFYFPWLEEEVYSGWGRYWPRGWDLYWEHVLPIIPVIHATVLAAGLALTVAARLKGGLVSSKSKYLMALTLNLIGAAFLTMQLAGTFDPRPVLRWIDFPV